MNERQFRILVGVMLAIGAAMVAVVAVGILWFLSSVQVVQNLTPVGGGASPSAPVRIAHPRR